MPDTLLKIPVDSRLTRKELKRILSLRDPYAIEEVFRLARYMQKKYVGEKIYLRGLIEYSNICRKNCFYCGLRRDNSDIHRYYMPVKEVLKVAQEATDAGYSSLVIQSGEMVGSKFIKDIEYLVREIKSLSRGKIGITLSCGEQTTDTYERWFDAGAHRYLLRIETCNQELFHQIHPKNELHLFERRIKALEYLKKTGYQVGSGVMIGMPGQSLDHLVDDLLFLNDLDVDMIGMGPYIPQEDTPMGRNRDEEIMSEADRLRTSLLMIAAARILMRDINIASTTALDILSTEGRIKAIKAGANILMPNFTPQKFKLHYNIYAGKHTLPNPAGLLDSFRSSGLKDRICFSEWGDSPHFLNHP